MLLLSTSAYLWISDGSSQGPDMFFGCHSIQYIDRASSTVLLLEQPPGTMHIICIKQYSKRLVDKEHGESETRELCLANTSYYLGNTRGHINAQD